MATDLSPEFRSFIDSCISSVAQLEALLLLRRTGQEWTLEAIGRELRIEPEGAAPQLAALARCGLVAERTGAGSEKAYRYAPRDGSTAALVDLLAAAYEDRRVTVIGAIYSRPTDTIRGFADAFRIRKDEDDG